MDHPCWWRGCVYRTSTARKFTMKWQDCWEAMKAKNLSLEIARSAISLGGTCSGEHGIGYGKLPLLEQEHGLEALDMMHHIKRALDPEDIFNPGKMGSLHHR